MSLKLHRMETKRRCLEELWLIRPFAVSPPRRFAPWLVRPRTWYHCDTTTETLCLQPSFYSFPRFSISITFIQSSLLFGESSKVRGRISQGANKPGAKEPGGETSRGRNGKGAKKPVTVWISPIITISK